MGAGMRTSLLLLLVLAQAAAAQEAPLTREEAYARAAVTEVWEPVPPIVTPGAGNAPPSDALVLFDGGSLDAWRNADGGEAGWVVADGAATVKAGAGNLYTRQRFGSVQLHIEWRTPANVESESQGRGNSGVFFMDRYEVQVLDSFANPTYPNGQAASVYKQHIPLVNASRGPGEWQSYDIVFMAPEFGANGRVARPATLTVFHNGVLVQNNVAVQGPTEFIGKPQYEVHGKAPIRLQDHSNPVSFRNIWLREL